MSELPDTSEIAPTPISNAKSNTGSKSSNVFHRSLSSLPHLAVSAQGSKITLSDGRTILDACGGAAVSCIGQGRPEVIAAVTAQMQTAGYVHTATYTTSVAEELASFILDKSPEGIMGSQLSDDSQQQKARPAPVPAEPVHDLERAYFLSSGSEAMDTSLKLARQYWFEKEGPQTRRQNFISRKQSYHGNTIAAMSVSSNLARKKPYKNFQDPNVHFLTPPMMRHYYPLGKKSVAASDHQVGAPNQNGGTKLTREEMEDEFAQQLADELSDMIQSLGADTVAAVVMETVGGATTGGMVSPRGYLSRVRRVLDAHGGILLILDEVMSGAGRTGTYWAFEQEALPAGPIRPDIVTMGKGLGGGYAPIAACLASRRVVDVIRAGSSSFVHGQTYQAHPLACAAALAVSKIVRNERLVHLCKLRGELLERRLKEEFEGKDYVAEVRGRGLFWGVELYDAKNARPFDPNSRMGIRIPEDALERGVAIYPGTGTIDGEVGDHILFAPAYTVTEQEIEQMVVVAKEACEAVVAEVRRDA